MCKIDSMNADEVWTVNSAGVCYNPQTLRLRLTMTINNDYKIL